MDKRQIRKQARDLIEDLAPEILGEDWSEDLWDPEMEYRSVYLGTVFSLTPSGKYYTLWACSNVHPCNRCKGSGCNYCGHLGSREAWEDEIFYDALDEYANNYDLTVQAGEGDPCDLFLFEYRDRE